MPVLGDAELGDAVLVCVPWRHAMPVLGDGGLTVSSRPPASTRTDGRCVRSAACVFQETPKVTKGHQS